MNIEVVEKGSEKSTNPAVIKVFGTGGGGSNAVNRMLECGFKYVDFIVANTDLQALRNSQAPVKLGLGANLTGGLGAGGKPEVGEKAAMEDKDAIASAIKGADMLFITAGMGGGTGTGSAPVIAQIAKEMEILTVAIVTKPFSFEGQQRMEIAEEGIKKLKEYVDAIIVIPNQNLYKVFKSAMPFHKCFEEVNEILRQAIQGISNIVYDHGLINVDLADVISAMKGQGSARMGIGIGEGENKAVEAANSAINNPLLGDSSFEGAKNILVNIYGSDTLSTNEVEEIMEMITTGSNKDAKIVFGACHDESLGDSVRVIMIATGFETENKKLKEKEETEIPETAEIKNAPLETLGTGDFVSSSEWSKISKMKQGTLPGLGARNESVCESKKEPLPVRRPVLDFSNISIPTESDLEKPAYYRYAK